MTGVNQMTKFTANEIKYHVKSLKPLCYTNCVSLNLYADGVLCGRISMTTVQFDEFTDRMRSEPLPQ